MTALCSSVSGKISLYSLLRSQRFVQSLIFTLCCSLLSTGLSYGGSLTFSSIPPDGQLDADPPPDIEVAPGDKVEYLTTISTFGLAGINGGPFPGVPLIPVVNFSYDIIYDPSELMLNAVGMGGSQLDLLNLFSNGSGLVDVGGGVVHVTHLGGNIAANNVRSLDDIVFTVLTPVNDGIADFSFANVLINGVAPPAGVFSFDQIDEVQPRAVPEPSTLSLLGLGLVGVAWARRKNWCRS